jgi:hypothetical protein
MVSKQLLITSILCFTVTNAEQLDYFDWTKVSNILNRENFPDFLSRFSYSEISEQCRTHTRNYAQQLANPLSGGLGGLTNTYWHLKSKQKNIFFSGISFS